MPNHLSSYSHDGEIDFVGGARGHLCLGPWKDGAKQSHTHTNLRRFCLYLGEALQSRIEKTLSTRSDEELFAGTSVSQCTKQMHEEAHSLVILYVPCLNSSAPRVLLGMRLDQLPQTHQPRAPQGFSDTHLGPESVSVAPIEHHPRLIQY